MIVIVLATYMPNLDFLRKQIASLQEQDHTEWQCVIIDDNSPEPTCIQIKKMIEGDSRFKFQTNEVNLGVFHNFEDGFKIARDMGAKIIFPCDQDDIWQPKKLSTLKKSLDKSKALLAYSDARLIDDSDNIVCDSLFKFENRFPGNINTTLLKLKNIVTGCCSAFKVELLDLALPFPKQGKQISFHHDLWLALCASRRGDLIFIEQPLIGYRTHRHNVVGPQKAKRITWRILLSPLDSLKRIENYTLLVESIDKTLRLHEDKKNLHQKDHNCLSLRVVSSTFHRIKYFRYGLQFLIGISYVKLGRLKLKLLNNSQTRQL
jgi:glycosyltransferase involved in cell wall biosynthesis